MTDVHAPNSSATGLRKSTGSWALVSRRFDDKICWLARWNSHWSCYNFVGGHRHEDETFRECLVREILEELHLMEWTHYRVLPPEPLSHLEYSAWSESAQQETHYSMEVYSVALEEETPYRHLITERPIRWLTRDEIEGGAGATGKPVSETMKRILYEVDWYIPREA